MLVLPTADKLPGLVRCLIDCTRAGGTATYGASCSGRRARSGGAWEADMNESQSLPLRGWSPEEKMGI